MTKPGLVHTCEDTAPFSASDSRVSSRALAAHDGLREQLISIDTFDSAVAREAVAAGAHIVNDVSGGSLDPSMHSVVRPVRVLLSLTF